MSKRLTIPEAAKLLRTSESTILRLIRQSAIRAINVGAGQERPRWIIDESDLDEFLRKRATAPPPRVRKVAREAVPNYL